MLCPGISKVFQGKNSEGYENLKPGNSSDVQDVSITIIFFSCGKKIYLYIIKIIKVILFRKEI